MSKTKKVIIIVLVLAVVIGVSVYAYKKWYMPKYGKNAGSVGADTKKAVDTAVKTDASFDTLGRPIK